MTITAQAGIDATIEKLEARHRELLGELGEVETAIGVLHRLRAPRLPLTPADSAPAAPAPSLAPVPPSNDDQNAGAGDDELPSKVRAVLKGGPVKRQELITKARITGNDIKRFVKRGLLTATGVTHGRRFALPGTAAKEAP